MGIEEIRTVCVVGSGTMGSQIAQQTALGGFDVWLTDVSDEQLQQAVVSNHKLMMRRVEKGQLSEVDATAALDRVRTTTSLEEGASGADFVFEAIVEKLPPKRQLFAALDAAAPSHAILATNSSTIPISKLADATTRPDRCCNTHFFHPVLVMQLCEVVRGPQTSDDTVATTMALIERIGRVPVLIEKEIDGFIVNRILHAASQEAMRLYEGGYADFASIDLAVEKGLNWPMGPFKLADFSGVDITYNARREKYEASGDEREKPPGFLGRMVDAGRLGRKTGKGFYDYSSGTPVPAEDPRGE
ncbi:MAG: 3-hydroxyacyl-CoA dehydrogenase family protein [Candidatus Dormibacteraeota bacterium]|nr:3-hydroxyacyl-CoA dehydrogenase family protein [Candidatus Dormibacteraeota bacterium]